MKVKELIEQIKDYPDFNILAIAIIGDGSWSDSFNFDIQDVHDIDEEYREVKLYIE